MPFCEICGCYKYIHGSHVCPPIYEVQHRENHCDDEWETIRATDHEDAAEKYIEKDDCESADYTVVSGGEAEVWVREKGSEDVRKFIVTGEGVPTYYATEIDG